VRIVDTALADEPLENAVFGRVEQAQQVHSILGDGLEAAERKNFSLTCSLQQEERLLYPIVVRHPNHLDAEVLAGLDNRGIIGRLRSERRGFVVPMKIAERVDLKGASIEARPIGQAEGRGEPLGNS
jgi:hypothetical protein